MLKPAAFFCFIFGLNSGLSLAQSDTNLIIAHFKNITKTEGFRSVEHIPVLDRTGDYLLAEFSKYSDSVFLQDYEVRGKRFSNVVCSFGTENSKRIIVGAHYDVCGDQEGADDNASGTIGLLELARQLKEKKTNYRIDLVAYTLEEPPAFRTKSMGSYIHAEYLHSSQIPVYGMISLEMIGFFKDARKTQEYPLKALKLIYGSRGNYITLVKKFGTGKFTKKFFRAFKRTHAIRTKKFVAPASLPGIDFSDHLNYWKFNFSALMITDTAFYRNKNYHQKTDTMETIDFKRMAKVIDGVLGALVSLK